MRALNSQKSICLQLLMLGLKVLFHNLLIQKSCSDAPYSWHNGLLQNQKDATQARVYKIDPNSNEPLGVYWKSFMLSTLPVNNAIFLWWDGAIDCGTSGWSQGWEMLLSWSEKIFPATAPKLVLSVQMWLVFVSNDLLSLHYPFSSTYYCNS